jgi:hypothetical protein
VRYVLDRAETAEVSDVTDTAVMLELLETAGLPIPQGKQGLFIYRVDQGAATLGGRNTSRLMGPSNENPCVKRGNKFQCRMFFSGPLTKGSYVLALVRLKQ